MTVYIQARLTLNRSKLSDRYQQSILTSLFLFLDWQGQGAEWEHLPSLVIPGLRAIPAVTTTKSAP